MKWEKSITFIWIVIENCTKWWYVLALNDVSYSPYSSIFLFWLVLFNDANVKFSASFSLHKLYITYVHFSVYLIWKYVAAENLLVYPPDHVIYGDYAYKIWDEEMIKYVLGFFKPDNMRIDVVTKSFDKSLSEFLYLFLDRMLWTHVFHALHILWLWNLILVMQRTVKMWG